jgi:hypothetical protein
MKQHLFLMKMNNTNPAKTIRVLTWLVMVLLLANIATLSIIWIRPHQRTIIQKNIKHNRGEFRDREMYMVKELDLDSSQVKFYRGSKKEYRMHTRKYQTKIDSNKAEINNQLFSPGCDSVAIYRMSDSIGQWTVKIENGRLDYLMKVKRMLQPEQLDKFRQVFECEDYRREERKSGRKQ